VETVIRQLQQAGARAVVAVSALNRSTLTPLLEKIGEMLSRDLHINTGGDEADRLSRIA